MTGVVGQSGGDSGACLVVFVLTAVSTSQKLMTPTAVRTSNKGRASGFTAPGSFTEIVTGGTGLLWEQLLPSDSDTRLAGRSCGAFVLWMLFTECTPVALHSSITTAHLHVLWTRCWFQADRCHLISGVGQTARDISNHHNRMCCVVLCPCRCVT